MKVDLEYDEIYWGYNVLTDAVLYHKCDLECIQSLRKKLETIIDEIGEGKFCHKCGQCRLKRWYKFW